MSVSQRRVRLRLRNYEDRKWRIVCDPRPFDERPTFKTREEAATAEWALTQQQTES